MTLLIDKNNINQDSYDDLFVSIQASKNILNLLICVCEQDDLRAQIIAKYEQELGELFPKYHVSLSNENLSLTAELQKLFNKYESLKIAKQAVITVTGIQNLLSLSFNDQKSELSLCLEDLQWTRSRLLKYPYSIVLWINKDIGIKLCKKSFDFWSWRMGVFRFEIY